MSKYFSDDEFRCYCCDGLPENGMDPNLLMILDATREMIGKPIIVNSGYRCPSHNQEVGGVSNSQHVQGTAADLTYEGIDVDYLSDVVEAMMIAYGIQGGIGKYWSQQFVHVDVQQDPPNRRWTEND